MTLSAKQIFLSTSTLVAFAFAGCTMHDDAQIAEKTPEQPVVMAQKPLVETGRVFMRRTKDYEPPKVEPAEPLEVTVRRIAEQAIKDSAARKDGGIEAAIRDIVSDTITTEGAVTQKVVQVAQRAVEQQVEAQIEEAVTEDSYMEKLAKRAIVDGNASVEQAIKKLARQALVEKDPEIQEAVRLIAQQAVVEADDSMEKALMKIAKRAVSEGDVVVEEAIRKVARQTLVDGDDAINAAIGKVAEKVVVDSGKPVEEAIRRVVNRTVLDGSEPIEFAVQRIVRNTVEGTEGDRVEAAIRKIVTETVVDSNEDIAGAISLVAKRAVVEADDSVKEAIAQVAQKTLDDNEQRLKTMATEAAIAVAEGFKIQALDRAGTQTEFGDNVTFDADGIAHVAATEQMAIQSESMGNPADWIPLNEYYVVVHDDNRKLGDMVARVMTQARPFVGPWQVKWKLKRENMDILNERFSLDAETPFSEFAGYLSEYMMGHRGFGLDFKTFQADRILVITEK